MAHAYKSSLLCENAIKCVEILLFANKTVQTEQASRIPFVRVLWNVPSDVF